MTVASKLETAGATLATVIAGVAAVGLTGDPRAFGVVVALVGVAAGAAIGWHEWRPSHSHRGANAGPRTSADTNVTRTA